MTSEDNEFKYAAASFRLLGEKFDAVDKPEHYNSHPSGIECIQVTEHMNFNLGNVIKYLWRTDHKNGLEGSMGNLG